LLSYCREEIFGKRKEIITLRQKTVADSQQRKKYC